MSAPRTFLRLTMLAASLSVTGCGATALYPISNGIGPNPILPPPDTSDLEGYAR